MCHVWKKHDPQPRNMFIFEFFDYQKKKYIYILILFVHSARQYLDEASPIRPSRKRLTRCFPRDSVVGQVPDVARHSCL